ncbi:hypothetical protein IW146_001750 [Coemansia sp. RSA 922]|nr:hypothetical protein GGI14_003421 [Coemansia sp. S680]KAJ2116146.1 hypothetical protein IW146_001750 [Coemansia sp. RSA 922]
MPSITTFSHSLLLAALLLLLQLAAAYPSSLAIRSATAADIGNFRGAILVKNGIATSCELALIDHQAAFVAASCLDFKDGQVNADTKYEVYFDGAKGQAPGRATIDPDDIHVNPLYSVHTFANNIAVVEFDFVDQGVWVNYLAVNRLEWNDIVYVRRQLRSASSMSWSTPSVMAQLGSDPGCAKASGLFASNQNDMLCSKQSVSSPVSDRCSLPYGSLYGVASKAMAISALYSHTVVYSDKMCNGGIAYNFYTQLGNYTRFARAVLDRKPFEYIENVEQYLELRHITSYRMENSRAPNDQGTIMFGGDLFAAQRSLLNLPVNPVDPTPPPPPPPPPKTPTVVATKPQEQQQEKPTDTLPVTLLSSSSTRPSAGKSDPPNGAGSQDALPTKTSNMGNFPTSLVDPADFPPGVGTGGISRVVDDDDDDDKRSDSRRGESSQSTSVQQDKAGQSATDDEGGFRGIPKGTAIALGVTIPLLVIMASIGAYFMHQSHRKRKAIILQANE